MSDPQLEKACVQLGIMAAEIRAALADTLEMIALHRNGHPRAQSFDPSGGAGYGPVEGAALDLSDEKGALARHDKAVADGKHLRHNIAVAHKAARRALAVIDDYKRAVRPERMPADYNAVLAELGCTMHALLGEFKDRGDGMGSLCRPCYDRRQTLRKHGLDLTLDDLRFYEAKGHWPKIVIDPKAPPKPLVDVIRIDSAEDAARALLNGQHLASVDNLALRLTTND